MAQNPIRTTASLVWLWAVLPLAGCNDRIPIVSNIIGALGARGDYVTPNSISAIGASTTLPSPGTRTVVWGLGRSDHDVSVENSAITWLQARGLVVIERAQLEQIFREQKLSLLHGDRDAELLRVGKLIGANQIVFIKTLAVSRGYLYSVTVRGVDVVSGQILWSGQATPAAELAYQNNYLDLVTYGALEAAWDQRNRVQER